MLTNQLYRGNMVQGRYGSVSYKSKQNKPKPKSEWVVVQNTHEPIISADLWDCVQARIQEKARPCTATGQIGLFAKKVRCLHCGYALRSCKNRGRHYYRCATALTGGDCIGAFVSLIQLSQLVLQQLQEFNRAYLDQERLEQSVSIGRQCDSILHRIQNQIQSGQHSIQDCTRAIKSLYTDKAKGLFTDEDFAELYKVYQEERAALNQQLHALMEEKQRLESQIPDVTSRRDQIQAYVNGTELEREHIDIFVEFIQVGKRDPVTNCLPVVIHWNF